MASKTILIAAGGTGGHLYPAIAVADELRRLEPDVRILFLGTRDRIESHEVPRLGYPFFPIAVEAPRKSIGSLVTFPFRFCKAILDAMILIGRERPSAFLGAGAYLSVPAGIAAWSLRVPIALIEINSVAGTANKLLSRLADKLFVAYPESRSQFPTRVSESASVSGTPVRADLGTVSISSEGARAAFGLDPARTTILIFGGSLGARAINEAVESASAGLVAHGLNLLWQTGTGASTPARAARFSNDPNVHVTEYIYDMERAYRAADLVVCRAGASSLAELARLGKPAILIPYPHAAANHQEANAQAFANEGAAIVVRDSELTGRLERTIIEVVKDTERLQHMTEAMHKRDNPDAASVVARWLIDRTL